MTPIPGSTGGKKAQGSQTEKLGFGLVSEGSHVAGETGNLRDLRSTSAVAGSSAP